MAHPVVLALVYAEEMNRKRSVYMRHPMSVAAQLMHCGRSEDVRELQKQFRVMAISSIKDATHFARLYLLISSCVFGFLLLYAAAMQHRHDERGRLAEGLVPPPPLRQVNLCLSLSVLRIYGVLASWPTSINILYRKRLLCKLTHSRVTHEAQVNSLRV